MLLLRIALLGLIAAWFAWRTVRMLKDGKATMRGGFTITRRRNPIWFWASIAVQLSLVAAGLVLAWTLISKTI
jgi:hypothetical protein